MIDMKKLLSVPLLLLAVVLKSCSISDADKTEFRDYFYYRISVIVEYDEMIDSGEEIHINDWFYFLENCSYLETLTGNKFHYLDAEPPYYECAEQLSADTTNLSKWYDSNKDKWSMKKADMYVYKKRRGHTVYF